MVSGEHNFVVILVVLYWDKSGEHTTPRGGATITMHDHDIYYYVFIIRRLCLCIDIYNDVQRSPIDIVF